MRQMLNICTFVSDPPEFTYGFDPAGGNQVWLWTLVSCIAVIAVVATRVRSRRRDRRHG